MQMPWKAPNATAECPLMDERMSTEIAPPGTPACGGEIPRPPRYSSRPDHGDRYSRPRSPWPARDRLRFIPLRTARRLPWLQPSREGAPRRCTPCSRATFAIRLWPAIQPGKGAWRRPWHRAVRRRRGACDTVRPRPKRQRPRWRPLAACGLCAGLSDLRSRSARHRRRRRAARRARRGR